MRLGDLNKRIALEYQTRVSDAMGGSVATWVEAETVWAAVWPTASKEAVEGGQTTHTVTHRIRIRGREDIRPSWRIRCGTRYFAIVSLINPNESGRWLDILVREASGG